MRSHCKRHFIANQSVDSAPSPLSESDAVLPSTASRLFDIPPYLLRLASVGPDAPIRPVFDKGRRLLRLRDVEGLARRLRNSTASREARR